ncbi:MAG: FAD-binding oxidoreductase [Candidatus Margulisbacteria bacterium]|nr:FAD-binding oxidoreductase [Candidatus Margulisiibacteriota bacterium]
MIKKTDQEVIISHLEDSSNLCGSYAEGLYLPENEAEIIEAARECNSKNIPLTISAAETATTGSPLPFGGWILNTQKLNKIIEINEKEKYAIALPGVTLEEIEKAVSKVGLLYPPDPTEKTATIGGNVSTNASGGRSYRFGSTRNWIRRLRVVLASGEVLDIPRGKYKASNNSLIPHPSHPIAAPNYTMPKTKNAAGYYSKPNMDLIDLFIGSEGTLGIISEVEIALAPALGETIDLVAFFKSESEAVDFVLREKSEPATESPACRQARRGSSPINFFEYFDAATLNMLRESHPNIPACAKAAVYIEQESDDPTYWAENLEGDVWLAMGSKQKQELQNFRHAIPEHINKLYKKHGSIKLASDIAVPTENFRQMLAFYTSQLTTHTPSLFCVKFGHIGENHLHVNLLPKSEGEKKIAKEIILAYVKKAVELGGTVSAEHGIGKIKHDYLYILYGEAGISEMKRIKQSFDPNWILGQGNIFSQNK